MSPGRAAEDITKFLIFYEYNYTAFEFDKVLVIEILTTTNDCKNNMLTTWMKCKNNRTNFYTQNYIVWLAILIFFERSIFSYKKN